MLHCTLSGLYQLTGLQGASIISGQQFSQLVTWMARPYVRTASWRPIADEASINTIDPLQEVILGRQTADKIHKCLLEMCRLIPEQLWLVASSAYHKMFDRK